MSNMSAFNEIFTHTDPNLLPVLEELKRREPIFHTWEFGTSRADFERATAPDYSRDARQFGREPPKAGAFSIIREPSSLPKRTTHTPLAGFTLLPGAKRRTNKIDFAVTDRPFSESTISIYAGGEVFA